METLRRREECYGTCARVSTANPDVGLEVPPDPLAVHFGSEREQALLPAGSEASLEKVRPPRMKENTYVQKLLRVNERHDADGRPLVDDPGLEPLGAHRR